MPQPPQVVVQVRQMTGFSVSADAYGRFMGRYSTPLATAFAEFAGVTPAMRVLDVGCGPGALTAVLAARRDASRLAAIDPADQFAAACRLAVPGADVRVGAAEDLPWADDTFDAALSQLVVSFMADAVAGIGEMRRVVAPGGVVAACMWEAGASMEMVDVFWRAARTVAPVAPESEQSMPYRTLDALRTLAEAVRLAEIETAVLSVQAHYADFEDFWTPMLNAAGPVGRFSSALDDDQRARVGDECRRLLGSPTGPFTLGARAVAFRCTVG